MRNTICLVFLTLLCTIVCEFAHGKRVENITAAIETLIPEKTEANQFEFEDIMSEPELAFEFSSGSVQSVDYNIFVITQLIHVFLWYIYWTK